MDIQISAMNMNTKSVVSLFSFRVITSHQQRLIIKPLLRIWQPINPTLQCRKKTCLGSTCQWAICHCIAPGSISHQSMRNFWRTKGYFFSTPVTGHAGPEGSGKLRLLDFLITAQYGGRLSALRTGRLYP